MEQQQAQMLAEICGADVDSCCAALHQCRGNADAAAALLMEATSEGAPLTTLLEMGYDRRSAEEALRQSKGDLQSAAEILQDVDTRVAPKNPHAGNLGVCAICTEPLNPADAAMRCAGRGGHHYGHAACLAQWVETCQSRNQEPTCPECRGPLQLRRRQIQEFLNEAPDQCTRPERRRVMRDVLERVPDGDDWQEIDWCQVAGFAALVAGGMLAVGMLAGLLLKDKKDRNSRSSGNR